QLSFPSTVGATYLILVHGYNQSQGEFTLSVSCADGCEVAENDVCTNATELIIQPVGGCESSTGSTECAYTSPVANPDCEPFGSVVDVWYRFNSGFVGALSIVAEALTAEVVNVALYSECNSAGYIACWTEVAAPINVAGLPENTDFLLRVWNGGGAETGTFSICLEADFNVGLTPAAEEVAVQLAPVPTQGELRISGLVGVEQLEVLDLQGRIHGQWTIANAPQATLDLSTLATGTYLLRSEDGRVLGRLVRAD
ncbi:MAG: T9SS type A sorting domain-containing protein, partial [Elusimicrobia bacterium]